MKKILFCTLFCLLLFTTGCNSNINITNDSSKSTQPQYLYSENPSIDMFVYQDIAFVNASDIDWVTELDLTKGDLFWTIEDTGVSKKFKGWDATPLDIGSNIYESEQSDILLVESNGLMIPYLKIVEG